jgi:hypothetical protein
MEVLGRLRLSFWIGAVGAVVLFLFFLALTTIPPAQVARVTLVMGVLAAMVLIRSIRLASVLAGPGGDPRVRRALNRQRERRGF